MMLWERRIIDPVELGPAGDPRREGDSPRLINELISEQAISWPGLREGLLALNVVEVRPIEIEGSEVLLQHNPARLVSTSARVDDASIRQRPCFLCPANMPAEEKGLAFGDQFVILCNPFPVLRNHLVVVSRAHVPQRLRGNIRALLDLAQALGPDYVSLYNGPRCGASAPDHLHFQAGFGKSLAILRETGRLRTASRAVADAPVLEAMRAYGAGFLVLRSQDEVSLERQIETVMDALAESSSSGEDEPMVNVIARHDTAGFEVIVVPREKHRPRDYFVEGEQNTMVSPAAIDLGGLLVVPRGADFRKLDASSVAAIYSEVTFTQEKLITLCETVSRRGGRTR